MPGAFPARLGAIDAQAPSGPVALHPIAVLTFEQLTERWDSQRRADAIRRVFGCSVTMYVQYLYGKVVSDENAAQVAPAVFDRLVRQRDFRRRLRGVSA